VGIDVQGNVVTVTHCPVGVDAEGCEGYVSFLLFFDHLCLLNTNSDLRAIQPPSCIQPIVLQHVWKVER